MSDIQLYRGQVQRPGSKPEKLDLYIRRLTSPTAEEAEAGIQTVNGDYPPGDIRRYGAVVDGTTDDSAAIQAALDANNNGGPPVSLSEGVISFASTLTVYNRSMIIGSGQVRTRLSYSGSGSAIAPEDGTVRTFNHLMRDFRLETTTGDVGLDMGSVSTSQFDNITIQGFTTGAHINSPTSGFSVYNRFTNVTFQTCTTGVLIDGLSSNANVFTSCRGNVCTDAVIVEDSNENHFNFCQFESGTRGVTVRVDSSVATRNYINQSRFEGNTTNITVGSGVTDTFLLGNHHVDGTPYNDTGTRTQMFDLFPNAAGIGMVSLSTPRESTDGAYKFERTSHASNFIPNTLIEDSGTTGNPTTLELKTGRSGGFLIRASQSGTDQFAVLGNGRIRTNQTATNTNTPAGATAAQLPIYDETGTLIGYIPVYASAW